MRKVLILGLALLVLVLSLPLMVSMADMADCPACPSTRGETVWVACLALISLLVLILPNAGLRRGRSARVPRELLLAARLERPPRDFSA